MSCTPTADFPVYRVNRPSKHSVRAWMQQRQHRGEPPPEPAQVRQQLDWRLVGAQLDPCAFGVVQTDDERTPDGSDTAFSASSNRVADA